MGKAMLIIVVAAVYTGGYLAFAEKRAQVHTTARQAEDAFKILARNAALVGLNRAEQLLSDDFEVFEDFGRTHEGSQYKTSSTNGGGNMVVRSTATVTTREGTEVTFYIRAVYKVVPPPPLPKGPPPFMRSLIVADGDLEFRGTPEGHAYIPTDGSKGAVGADIHTNGYLEVMGTSTYFEGFGTYVEGALKDEDWVSQSFHPLYNPTESKTAFETEAVSIPDLNPGALAISMTADSTTTGSVIVKSLADMPPMNGTREDPYVWYIEGGSLLFQGDVKIPGYAIILVDNHIELGGNVTVTPMSYDGEDESTVAFYAGSNVTLKGNAEIWAQIFAGGDVDIEAKGTPTFYGNIVSHGKVIFRGTPDIYHRQASPALTTPWNVDNSADRLERISYSEW